MMTEQENRDVEEKDRLVDLDMDTRVETGGVFVPARALVRIKAALV